jgi:hypothetical protein
VHDNVVGYLAEKFAFGPKQHKMRFEKSAVQMAKKG